MTEIKLPAMSPTMEEGTLAKWLVAEGATVKPGDVLAEIETDKATMELEADDGGVVVKLHIPEGTDGVKVGTVIATIAGEGEDAAPSPSHAEDGAGPSLSLEGRGATSLSPRGRGRLARQRGGERGKCVHATSPSGFSTSCLNTCISCAPSAPSMARWSKLPVALITVAMASASFTT